MSNVTGIFIALYPFTIQDDYTAATFDSATITIEPYDGNDIIISSNPPNIYKPRFFGGNGYSIDNDDVFVYSEELDTTTLSFAIVNQTNLLSVTEIGLVIQFPRYQLLALHVDRYKGPVNVLPGFDNLKSIYADFNVVLNAQLTAPVTNFTLGAGSTYTVVPFQNSYFFTIERNNNTTSNHNLIVMNYKEENYTGETQELIHLYDLAIHGAITKGATSAYLIDTWEQYQIFVEGPVTNFDLYLGDINIHDDKGCSGVNVVVHNNTSSENEHMMNPSCQQIGGDIIASSSTFDKNTSLFPELLLECTNSNFCVITWLCDFHHGFVGCIVSPEMCHDVNSASAEVNGGLLAAQFFGMISLLMVLV